MRGLATRNPRHVRGRHSAGTRVMLPPPHQTSKAQGRRIASINQHIAHACGAGYAPHAVKVAGPTCGPRSAHQGTHMVCDVGDMSWYLLPVKMSRPVMFALAWPCLPVLEVVISVI